MGTVEETAFVTEQPKSGENFLSRVNAWLEAHAGQLVLIALAAGFIIRVYIAGSRYLVPDEALDFLLINQTSAIHVYYQSLTQAHPPLFYFILYYWHMLGISELMLRFPSVIAGTLMPWVAFLWLKRALGRAFEARIARAGAFFALLLLAFTPPAITYSTEIRPYGVLLCFIALSLWSLDRAFERNSFGAMMLFALFLCLALSTQYSAIWFAIAAGVYALARIVQDRFGHDKQARRQIGKSAILGWVISQAAAIALFGFFWVSHISKLQGSSMQQQAITGWLEQEYLQPGKSVWHFIAHSNTQTFQYLLAQTSGSARGISGAFIALFFILAVVLTFRAQKRKFAGRAWPLGLLFLSPFVIGCGAALVGLYPYGSSRHIAYLEIFALAGTACGIGWLSRRAFGVGLLCTSGLLLACALAGNFTESIPPADQARKLMTDSVEYLKKTVPQGGVVVTDYSSSLVLRYYLGCGQAMDFTAGQGALAESPCGNYVLAHPGAFIWSFNDVDDFGSVLAQMEQKFDWKRTQAIWFFHCGETPLSLGFFRRYHGTGVRYFRYNINFARLPLSAKVQIPRARPQNGNERTM